MAVARGEQEYFDPSGIATATEACKSNALMRCCKDLGVASELWCVNRNTSSPTNAHFMDIGIPALYENSRLSTELRCLRRMWSQRRSTRFSTCYSARYLYVSTERSYGGEGTSRSLSTHGRSNRSMLRQMSFLCAEALSVHIITRRCHFYNPNCCVW